MPEINPETVDSLSLWSGFLPCVDVRLGNHESVDLGDDQICRVSNVSDPSIMVSPPIGINTGTAVVVCPGGGYQILAWDLEGTEIVRWLNSCGITGILLKYRCPSRPGRPRYEAGVQDLQRALSIVRSRSAEWGICPDRIGALGCSAGGNAVAVASAGALPRLYEPVDAHDEIPFRPNFSALIYPAWLVDSDTARLVSEVVPDADTPPAFLVHAHDDALTSESSVAYYLALKRLGLSAELHVYANGGHGFGLRKSRHAISGWPNQFLEWMIARGLMS
ncbi:MAG: alpha/beta hydrolase [Planctomycetes bacterium]|nr:alpha/beta hydrolase [Planctomycetota bacterium]